MQDTRVPGRRSPRSGILAGVLAALAVAGGCAGGDGPAPSASPPPPPVVEIRLATTTSTRDSGLLDHLLPLVERETGVRVAVLAVGSGQALRIGADGDCDLLMTHDPRGEEELVAAGGAVERRTFMCNDFVIVGPEGDPARVRGAADGREALRRVAAAGGPWLSRGDDSGTHRKEKRLLAAAGLDATGPWYRETGQGMGATLAMAAETGAYTLTDRGTWLAHGAAPRLPLLLEGDPDLRNPYAVMVVNPARHPHVRADGARRVAAWLAGPRGRAAISGFLVKGRPLFFPLDGN